MRTVDFRLNCFWNFLRHNAIVACVMVASSLMAIPAVAQTVPSSPPLNAQGWTVFTPSTDTRIVYVSSSTGSDSNDGLSQSTPVQTLGKGSSLLRRGYPDWLLLKKGDTWTGDKATSGLFPNGGFPLWQGRSSTEPVLISSYGSGPRPLIQGWTSGGNGGIVETNTNWPMDYVAIVGIEFYSYQSDPNNPAYTSTGSNLAGFIINNPANWILIEDCKLRFLGSNFSVSSLLLRRNIIVDSFSMGTMHGFYSYLLLEENLFDHNGWNAAVEPRSIFQHNVYGQSSTQPAIIVYRGNISANGSDVGLRSRGGGLIDNNLLIQNGYGIDYGQADGTLPNGPGPFAVQNNVILSGLDITGTGFTPVGISVAAVAQPISITNNLIAHSLASSSRGIALNIPSQSAVVSKNVIVDWGAGAGAIYNSGTTATVTSDNITNTGSSLSGLGFPDPSRTMASYASTIGLAGSLDAFLAAARLQSKDNWNPALMAAAVNDYLRAGFGMTATLTSTTYSNPITSTSTPTTTTASTTTSTTTTSSTTSPTTTTSPTSTTTSTTTSPTTSTTSSSTTTTPTTTTSPTTATVSPPVPPTVILASPANGTVVKGNAAVNVSVSVSDAAAIASIAVLIDGVRYMACSGTAVCSAIVQNKAVSQGVHVISAQAVDAAGAIGQASASVTWLR